ncbi:MAG: hypothetical protein HQL53_10945 [Magnetococcales bacterium]|nr:hypothetical protein [Magnetococcales bacterium]
MAPVRSRCSRIGASASPLKCGYSTTGASDHPLVPDSPVTMLERHRQGTQSPLRPVLLGALICSLLMLTGCAAGNSFQKESPEQWVRNSGFQLSDLAKSDVNLIIETHQKEAMRSLMTLMRILYRLNPKELKKSATSLTAMTRHIFFDPTHNWTFSDLQGKRNIECLNLAFDPRFQGDRVKALTVGMGSMIMASYDDKREFYFLNLDPQKLFNSARNLEIISRRLANRQGSEGRPLLQTHTPWAPRVNIGFERLFGKMIATQDVMAKIVAQKNKRLIKNTLQFIASSVFLPI